MLGVTRIGAYRMKVSLFMLLYVLTTAIYLPFRILSGKDQLLQPCLLILFSLYSLFILFKKQSLSLSLFETAALAFLLFSFLKSTCHPFRADSVARLLLIPVLYFSCKDLIQKEKTNKAFMLIAPVMVLVLVFIADALESPMKSASNGLFLSNKSILSIHISALVSFLCCFLFNPSKNIKTVSVYRLLATTVLILILPILIQTEGRAGWIGLLTALLFLAGKRFKFFPKLYVGIASLIVLGASISFIFFFKADSSKGRLLIYKISGNILARHWLSGIGNGGFKQQYNLYQAEYFTEHGIDSKEALLADDSYYAFNDYYQLLIENGLTGFVMLAIAAYFLVCEKRKKADQEMHALSAAAQASLICIATTALFSYPFQNMPILVQSVICIAIIHTYPQPGIIKLPATSARFIFSSFSILLLGISLGMLYSKARVNKANSISRTGFHKEAIKFYSSCFIETFDEGPGLSNYARELYYINQPLKARHILDRAMQLYSSSELYLLSAKIDRALNNYPGAENSLTKAVYMVPAKMRTRFGLFRFYLDTGDTSKACFWRKSILNMPVKVPSVTTAQMLDNTKNR
jgi:O-antigen ligase